MRESTTAVCRHCGKRFPLNPRAGRNTGRGARRALSYAPAKYCSDAHRVAASRDRISRNSARAGAIKGPSRPTPLSAVTAPPQRVELSREITTQKTVLDRPQLRSDVRIVPIDARWSLGSDKLQWILRRRRGAEWRDVSFVSSTKDILARCMREKGVPADAAAAVLADLPDTFAQWWNDGAEPLHD